MLATESPRACNEGTGLFASGSNEALRISFDMQVSGVSSVGPNSTVTPGLHSSDGESDTYNIKFTFLANPLAKEVPLKPTEGVTRITGGQLGDSQTVRYGTDAFTELVARMYFNLVTAALGNECSPGCVAIL